MKHKPAVETAEWPGITFTLPADPVACPQAGYDPGERHVGCPVCQGRCVEPDWVDFTRFRRVELYTAGGVRLAVGLPDPVGERVIRHLDGLVRGDARTAPDVQ